MTKRRVLGPAEPAGPAGATSIGATPISVAIGAQIRSSSSSRTASPSSLSSVSSTSTADSGGTEPLKCPICADTMLTLSQLNRHLDDEHSRSSEGQIELDFKNWFKKKVVDRANELVGVQPLQQRQKQLKLDVFDSNFTVSEVTSGDKQALQPLESAATIPRGHWRKLSGSDVCAHPQCKRALGIKNGQVNCRKCGLLFCNTHSMYRVKLNSALGYDPETGYWCRCCEGCFLGKKPAWNVAQPGGCAFERERTGFFAATRARKADSVRLEVITLEKRLLRLLLLHKDVESGRRSGRELRRLERELVPWEDDSSVSDCGICNTRFGFWNRKHHCRVCGDVVCGDPSSGCSMDVPVNIIVDVMNVNAGGEHRLEKFQQTGDAEMKLRLCLKCKQKLFNKRLLQKEAGSGRLSEFVQFHSQFALLRSKLSDESCSQQRQIELFGRLEKLGKLVSNRVRQLENRLEQLPNEGGFNIDECRLYKSLNAHIVLFLQDKLPELRKTQQAKLREEQKQLEQQRQREVKTKKLMKREVREFRDKLMVLSEQKFMVEKMYEELKGQRKFEDLKVLDANLRDLEREIEVVQGELGEEAF